MITEVKEEIKKKKKLQIEGLRSILCLFIMLFHFLIQYFNLNGMEPLFRSDYIPNALIFVNMFFIISGMFFKIDNLKVFWIKK